MTGKWWGACFVSSGSGSIRRSDFTVPGQRALGIAGQASKLDFAVPVADKANTSYSFTSVWGKLPFMEKISLGGYRYLYCTGIGGVSQVTTAACILLKAADRWVRRLDVARSPAAVTISPCLTFVMSNLGRGG